MVGGALVLGGLLCGLSLIIWFSWQLLKTGQSASGELRTGAIARTVTSMGPRRARALFIVWCVSGVAISVFSLVIMLIVAGQSSAVGLPPALGIPLTVTIIIGCVVFLVGALGLWKTRRMSDRG